MDAPGARASASAAESTSERNSSPARSPSPCDPTHEKRHQGGDNSDDDTGGSEKVTDDDDGGISEAEVSDEEEVDDDDEPRLKYAYLTKHLGSVYRNGDATSTFLVAGDKMVRLWIFVSSS